MTSLHHRLGWLITATTAFILITFAGASAASAGTAPPACPAGSFAGAYPPPACVHGPSTSDPYATQIGGREISLTHRIVGHGQFAYELVTVTASFSDALPECPEGGVPLGDIPCQQLSANLAIAGRYLAKHKQLDTTSIPQDAANVPADTPDCTPQATQGTCTYSFRLYEDQLPGYSVWVMSVGVGQITQNPANDLGGSSYEFSIGVTVPRLKVSKPRATAG